MPSSAGRNAPSSTSLRSPWLVFAVCAASTYIVTLDISIVNVAFPEIASAFPGTTRAGLSWVVTAYNIFYAGLLVASGKTADRVGRKPMLLAGTALFAVGSVLAAAAPTLGALVAGRVVQGVGGAISAPASLGLLLAAFPPQRRTQLMALFGAVGALGIASGPSIGAVLISVTNWRAAFWVNLPVCAAVIGLGWVVLRDTPRVTSANRPDYLGAAMITIALGSLALGLSQSDRWGWTDPKTLGALALTALIIPLFVRRQARHVEPVLDLSLFSARSFTVANAAATLFAAGFAAFGLNNVLFLRQVWGMSVLRAGLITAIGPLTVALTAPVVGKWAASKGFRPPLLLGPVLLGTAVLTYRFVLDDQQQIGLWLAMGVLGGLGVACIIPVNAAAAVAELAPERFAIGGAVTNTARQIGSVVGVAALVSLIGEPESPAALLDAYPARVDVHCRGGRREFGDQLLPAVAGPMSRQPERPATRAVALNRCAGAAAPLRLRRRRAAMLGCTVCGRSATRGRS